MVLYSKEYIYLVLPYSMDFKALWEFWNALSKVEPDKFTGLVGIVAATVYKTEPIFTGFGHGKFS